ncbi:MAG: methylated-DNA--[protein]-cysteine S-methyltransferase [Candidatus Limnocylindrales bacterium]
MSVRDARKMVEALRSSDAPAPDSLLGMVLSRVGLTDAWTEIDGPIGPLLVAWGAAGITAVERSTDAGIFEADYELWHGRPVRRVAAMPSTLLRQVRRRIEGRRTDGPAIDLDRRTPFEQAVLRKTMEIPYGEVRPYSWVAREIGRPKAVRAVGSALAGNPVPFVIPCHRVVRADGHIGQYGAGGPEAKREVLALEGVDPGELERLAVSGVRYAGSDSTGIYCYPSCQHARRISRKHVVHFRSELEARDAGYRPCKVCRPLETTPFADPSVVSARAGGRAPGAAVP